MEKGVHPMEMYRWAEQRDGLLTVEVLRRSGWSDAAIEYHRSTGRLRPVRRGVVAINGTPPTWRQAVRAVLLGAAVEVALSHTAAVRVLLGWVDHDEEQIHVLVATGHQVVLDGVRCHRSVLIEPDDIVRRGELTCTSPLRTVIDLSGRWSTSRLGELVDEFMRRNMLDIEVLRERVDRLRPAPGRSIARLRSVVGVRLHDYHPGESALEARIAQVIIAERLPPPVQQLTWTVGARRYRFDFAWPEQRVYLEGNGFGFHSMASDLEHDARRQNDLVADGWRPIEITWGMSRQEIAASIRRMLT
jgi:very-short-patch-repair endonuclease